MNSFSSPVRNNNRELVCPGAPRLERAPPVVVVPAIFNNDDHMPPPIMRLGGIFEALAAADPVPGMADLNINGDNHGNGNGDNNAPVAMNDVPELLP